MRNLEIFKIFILPVTKLRENLGKIKTLKIVAFNLIYFFFFIDFWGFKFAFIDAGEKILIT
jgi:hypothetical protein